MQINYGPAVIHQTNTFASPSLDEDLRSLRAHNLAYARRWLIEQDSVRRKKILNEYEKAHEILNDVCEHEGAGAVVDLLYGMNSNRLMWLLERLKSEYQQQVFLQLALRLALDGDTARSNLAEYAKVDPGRTAHLLINVAHIQERGAGKFYNFLPGIGFLISLPDQFAAPLLDVLVFDPRLEGEQMTKRRPEACMVLSRLIEEDIQRAAQLVAKLSPLRRSECVRLLRLAPAVKLLMILAELSLEVATDIVNRVPWPLGRALMGRAAQEADRKLERPGRTTSWPWVDGSLAAIASLPYVANRIIHSGEEAAFSLEIRNVRDTWQAASWAVKDSEYYRRQRNHIGWLAIVLAVIALLLWVALTLAYR
ncbi:hypothetical protein [Streptosporangium sp. NPDC048865]|uniref:hypothetical protein n=1 Tax=Streptosporangium sp. NPDC048865 TaxID=3155766 RepID=UPI00343330C1